MGMAIAIWQSCTHICLHQPQASPMASVMAGRSPDGCIWLKTWQIFIFLHNYLLIDTCSSVPVNPINLGWNSFTYSAISLTPSLIIMIGNRVGNKQKKHIISLSRYTPLPLNILFWIIYTPFNHSLYLFGSTVMKMGWIVFPSFSNMSTMSAT